MKNKEKEKGGEQASNATKGKGDEVVLVAFDGQDCV
jgi:hypothetical protein